MSSALRYALRSNPNSTFAACPMLDKSLGNAYGEPAHTHYLHYICPVQAARSSCLIGGKPPCGRSPPMSRRATIWFSVTRKIPFAQVKRQGHSHHTSAELRLVSLSLCPFHSRPRLQVPIRAEKCEHICFETQPHTPMWAAFRTGSAGRRWAFRCGHRLTAHYIGGYRGDKPLRLPTLATYNPHAFGFC